MQKSNDNNSVTSDTFCEFNKFQTIKENSSEQNKFPVLKEKRNSNFKPVIKFKKNSIPPSDSQNFSKMDWQMLPRMDTNKIDSL